ASGTYSGVGMRDPRLQREVCAAIYAKLTQPEFADVYEALRRHPAAFSPLFRRLVQVLASHPRRWPYLASLAKWWLNEACHGRRPGLLRDLTARFRKRSPRAYSKKMQP